MPSRYGLATLPRPHNPSKEQTLMTNDLSDQEMAEILAATEALSNMPPVERRAAELLKELLDGWGFTPRDTAWSTGDA